MNEPPQIAIHICNSHEPTLQPKIVKEYVLPTHGEIAEEKVNTPNNMYKSLIVRFMIESEYH